MAGAGTTVANVMAAAAADGEWLDATGVAPRACIRDTAVCSAILAFLEEGGSGAESGHGGDGKEGELHDGSVMLLEKSRPWYFLSGFEGRVSMLSIGRKTK